MRAGEIKRTTKETDVAVKIDLDGSGVSDVATGIGFFDHMLEAFAKHGAFDLMVRATGDLHIDHHHTVEDVGIVMGQAFKAALGEADGVRRFGHAYVPMDETLSRAAVDLANRPYLVWRLTPPTPLVGVGSTPGMDTQLFKEWFHAFAWNSGACVHVENLYGENTHHIIESAYKALARALRMAVETDGRLTGAPSTKGVL